MDEGEGNGDGDVSGRETQWALPSREAVQRSGGSGRMELVFALAWEGTEGAGKWSVVIPVSWRRRGGERGMAELAVSCVDEVRVEEPKVLEDVVSADLVELVVLVEALCHGEAAEVPWIKT